MTHPSTKHLPVAYRLLGGLLLASAFLIGPGAIASATSVPSPSNQRLYWGAIGGVYSSHLDGSDQKKVVNTSGVAWSLDVDPEARKLYWYSSQPQRGVYQANLDGSQQQLISPYSGLALRLSVDWPDNHLYWADASRDEIVRAELDGANPTVVFSQQIAEQKGITLGNVWSVEADPVDGTIFISGAILSYSRIWRTDRNFGTFTEMASWDENGTISPKEVAVDSATGDIYWTDEISEGLFRTTAPGVHKKIIPSGFPYVAHGITVDPLGRKLYWTNQNLGTVYTANLDGTGIQQIASGYTSIQGIVVGPAIPEPAGAILGSFACLGSFALRRSLSRQRLS